MSVLWHQRCVVMSLQFGCHHEPQVWILLLNSHWFRFNIVMKRNMLGKQRQISETKTSMHALQYFSSMVFSCWPLYKANCVVIYWNFIMQLHFFIGDLFEAKEMSFFFYFEFQFNIDQTLHFNGKNLQTRKNSVFKWEKMEWIHIKEWRE